MVVMERKGISDSEYLAYAASAAFTDVASKPVSKHDPTFWRKPEVRDALNRLDEYATYAWSSQRIPVMGHVSIEIGESAKQTRALERGGRIEDQDPYRDRPTGELYMLGPSSTVPTRDAVFGLERKGSLRNSGQPISKHGPSSVFAGALMVGQLLNQMAREQAQERQKGTFSEPDVPLGVLAHLLIFKHPRRGVYQQEILVQEVDGFRVTRPVRFSDFRPRHWTVKALAGYKGTDPGRYLDTLLQNAYRGFVERLAGLKPTAPQD